MKEDINIRYRGCHIRYYSSMFSLDYNSSAIVFAKAIDEFSRRFKVTVSLLLPRNAIHEKKKEKEATTKTMAAIDSVLDSVDANVREKHRAFYRRRHTRGNNSLASVRDCIYKRAAHSRVCASTCKASVLAFVRFYFAAMRHERVNGRRGCTILSARYRNLHTR